MTTVIGLGYRAGSGKDTAAAEIIAQRRYDIRRYAFADALKREVNAEAIRAGGMLNLLTLASRRFVLCDGYYKDFPDWVVYDPYAPMDDPMCPLGKQRTLLQWWGAEYRRAQDPNYWVKRLAESIAKDNPKVALITDLRFPNEMQFVREQDGYTVRVDRPDLPPATHISETALEDSTDWDYILDNSSSLEQLKEGSLALFDDIYCTRTSFPYGYSCTGN